MRLVVDSMLMLVSFRDCCAAAWLNDTFCVIEKRQRVVYCQLRTIQLVWGDREALEFSSGTSVTSVRISFGSS